MLIFDYLKPNSLFFWAAMYQREGRICIIQITHRQLLFLTKNWLKIAFPVEFINIIAQLRIGKEQL